MQPSIRSDLLEYGLILGNEGRGLLRTIAILLTFLNGISPCIGIILIGL